LQIFRVALEGSGEVETFEGKKILFAGSFDIQWPRKARKRRGMRGGSEEGRRGGGQSFSRDFFVLVEVCCACARTRVELRRKRDGREKVKKCPSVVGFVRLYS
jgi:hypothetical protein